MTSVLIGMMFSGALLLLYHGWSLYPKENASDFRRTVKQQQEDGHLMSLSPIQHIRQSPVPPTLGQQSPVPAVLKESLGDAVVGAVRRKVVNPSVMLHCPVPFAFAIMCWQVVEKLSQSKNGLRRQQNESECDINLAYSILVHGRWHLGSYCSTL